MQISATHFSDCWHFSALLSYAAEFLVVSWQLRKKTSLALPPVLHCKGQGGVNKMYDKMT
jgi:hypothetical protein